MMAEHVIYAVFFGCLFFIAVGAAILEWLER